MTTTTMTELFAIIAEKLGVAVVRHQPLSGGDISNVFLLETAGQRFLLKSNSDLSAAAMFKAEVDALSAISATNTIQAPAVHLTGKANGVAFLVMDYIESKPAVANDFERFGESLAQLHTVSTDNFGWSQDNYIGSLHQSNQEHSDWPVFYTQRRLLPQLQLAIEKKMLAAEEVPSEEMLMAKAGDVLPAVSPALLHGDLWSGNFLIASDGTPYLIDPAIYYGHGEVDLAMSRLFGGFDVAFYQAYSAVRNRIPPRLVPALLFACPLEFVRRRIL